MRWAIAMLGGLGLILGCHRGDVHLDRAQGLIERGQWANARTELGQVPAGDAGYVTARGLMLYCLDHEDDRAGVQPYWLYQSATQIEDPAWKAIDSETRKIFEGLASETRKQLFDKGIDSKDNADLVQVVIAAARFGFAHDDHPEHKATDAALLAYTHDAPASAYLVDQLKGQHPEPIIGYLVDIGAPMIDRLQAAIADKGFIGKRAALEALARIRATQRASDWIAHNSHLVDPSRKANGKRLERSAIANAAYLFGVHAQYVALDDGADDGAVLLQSWDDNLGAIRSELFASRGGELFPLRTTRRDGTAFDLGGGSPLFELGEARGLITMHRLQETTSDVEVDASTFSAPRLGARVRLRGYEPHGTIVREDDGLWVVKPDQPIQGLSELSVATSSLVVLKAERRTSRSVETLAGKLGSDRWELVASDLKPESPQLTTND